MLSLPNNNMVKKSSWLERKILKPAKNLAIAGAAVLVLAGGIQNVQGQTTPTHFYGEQNLNPFIQHNIKNGGRVHWDYYGSGDADGNDTLNYADYVAMQQGVSNDRTDLNGDEVANSQDLVLMSDFLNGTIKYLPAHWDLLQTRLERENWLNKAKTIDQTDTTTYVDPGFNCGGFTIQTIINFDGVENIGPSVYNPNILGFNENGRFNIPTYDVSTDNIQGLAHAIYGVFIGDSIDFNSLQTVEPQTDGNVAPGSWSIDPNSHANLWKQYYLYSQNIQIMKHTNSNVINFDLNNGNATMTNIHPWVTQTKRQLVPLQPTNETIPSDTIISLGQSTDTSNVNYVTNISEGADVFYNDSIVDFGNGSADIYRTFSWKPFHHWIDSTAPTTQLKEYPWHWLHIDSLGTQVIHVVDDQAPNISVTSPVHQVAYGDPVPSPQFSTSDNSGLPVNVTYVGDSTTQQPNGCGEFNYEQWLKYQASDPAGNTTNITFKNAEIYKPDNSIQFTHVPQDTIMWQKWDTPNVQDLEGLVLTTDVLYPQNNLGYNYTLTQIGSTAGFENYEVGVYVTGDCGCERDTSFIAKHDLVNSTEDYWSSNSSCNAYPNPTQGALTVAYETKTTGDIRLELWGMEGKKLKEKAFENVAPGEHKLYLNMGEYEPGIYLIRAMDSEGKPANMTVIKMK